MSEDGGVRTTSAVDDRRPAYGLGRVLILVYGIFAVAATARATVRWSAPRPRRRWPTACPRRPASSTCWPPSPWPTTGAGCAGWAGPPSASSLVGVLTVGTLSLVRPDLFPHDTVWSRFGSGYGYVPAVLPVLGLGWLWHSSPARVAARAERR